MGLTFGLGVTVLGAATGTTVYDMGVKGTGGGEPGAGCAVPGTTVYDVGPLAGWTVFLADMGTTEYLVGDGAVPGFGTGSEGVGAGI